MKQGVKNYTKMEQDIEKLKQDIKEFIEKYKLKSLKISTSIAHHSRINDSNSKNWVIEYFSKVEKIDVNLTK